MWVLLALRVEDGRDEGSKVDFPVRTGRGALVTREVGGRGAGAGGAGGAGAGAGPA